MSASPGDGGAPPRPGRSGGDRDRPPAGLHPDRLLPAEPGLRAVARELLAAVTDLPIVAVHGHVDPGLLVADRPFPDPATLLVTTDHYVVRALHSVGVPLADLAPGPGGADPRAVWRTFCARWPAFRGTATRSWLEHELVDLLGVDLPLRPETADDVFDAVTARLQAPDLRPRALFARFGLELLSTTDAVDADFAAHARLQADGLTVVPTVRPDAVTDPTRPGWTSTLDGLGIGSLGELVDTVRRARERSRAHGAVATDHGHAVAHTEDLGAATAGRLWDRVRRGRGGGDDAVRLGGHLLTQMALMSLDDGLVMQLHPGIRRDHDRPGVAGHGPDRGADFPVPVGFTDALRPLLERTGNEPGLRLVVFTADETTWSRELAPMASYYPGLYLGAPWWFLDAPDAMARHFAAVAETAGYAKLTGFVDDTRALCSIPARHDVARRAVCSHLARQVGEHRLGLDEAAAVAADYAYGQPVSLYRRR